LGGSAEAKQKDEVNIKTYTKYLLKEGNITEKRDPLANLRSRLICKDCGVTLLSE